METRTMSEAQVEGPGADPVELCTLPPTERADRTRWIRQEILPHAVETLRLERGVALELLAEPGLAQRIDELIRLERECCSSIVFERAASDTPGRLRFEIRGVDPDAAIFRALDLPGGPASTRRRFALSAGIGSLGSLFICCVLPIAGAAVLGSGGAYLASLDNPLAIGGIAVASGSGAWWWLGRRS